MAANTKGLIYYKLDANSYGYPGDITKNGGLRGEEIDGNFNFLRGCDIKEVTFDDKGVLSILKYNGEILKATPIEKPVEPEIIEPELPEYSFSYDSEKGILTIITPKGEEIKIEGFITEVSTSNKIFHDDSLIGDGTEQSILRVSNISKTGQYAPAIKLIDTLTEKLPVDNVGFHDRYVTKEYFHQFGKLYPLNGVKKIKERLEEINSEWRIPSKEDWDELLNTLDCNNPNHNSNETNVDLGENAGYILKSNNGWVLSNGELLSTDACGFSILPVGYCGNRGKDFYGSFGVETAFWTSTVNHDNNQMFVKSFSYDKTTVAQHCWGEDYYLSIRLVKDFNGDNFYGTETINGYTSNCLHIAGTNTVWTQENISFSQEEFEGFTPEEWFDENEKPCRYYINEWNGKSWDRQEIKNGESIVLYENENFAMGEWMVLNGELINHIGLTENNINIKVNEIYESFKNERNERLESEEEIRNNITSETNRAIEAESSLRNSIESEIIRAKESESEISNKVNDRFNACSNQVSKLNEDILKEIERATASEKVLNDNLISEQKRAILAETNLDEKIKDALQYNGNNAISVTNVNGDKWINLIINPNDKVLTNDINGLAASLSLKWVKGNVNGGNDELQLIGKNNLILSRINIAEFIKDGMLESVNLDTTNPQSPILNFIFNSDAGKDKISLNVKDLIDVYHPGNGLTKNNNVFSVIIDPDSDPFIDVTERGIKLTGIQKAIDNIIFNPSTNPDVNELKTKINVLEFNVTENKNNITQLRSDVDELPNSVIETVNKLNEPLHKRIEALNGEITRLQEELLKTKKELDNLKINAITNIEGTNNEISVSKTDNNVVIGFAPDAYFIASDR